MSQELDELKRDEAALWRCFEDLGGKRNPRDPKHNSCPLCGDDSGFMIGTGRNDIAGWRCYAGKSAACAHASEHKFTGSIVDLWMRARGLESAAACKAVLERYGRGSSAAGSRRAPAAAQPSTPARKEGKRYPSAMEAITALQFGLGKQGATLGHVWKYHDAAGVPVMEVVRFNMANGKKEFRPIVRDGQGWRIGLGPWGKEKLCPLYELPAVLKSAGQVLHVTEGEKCADALRELGYAATTSQGGAGRARETDWTPAAAAARVLLWRDLDAPGEKYAGNVAELIAGAAAIAGGAVPEIVIVDLGEVLAAEKDVFDASAELRTDGKSDDEIRAALNEYAARYGRRWLKRVEISYPGQPAPYPGIPAGERPELCNYEFKSREVQNEKGETETKKTAAALPIERILERLQKITGGWPCRVKSLGSNRPLLFVDQAGADYVRLLGASEQFAAWLHEICTLRFNPKQDAARANYVKTIDLFNTLGGAAGVNEYLAVQPLPHEPLIDGHYYLWRPPADYVADGRRFAGLLKFFGNTKDAASRAVMAAAFMTPGWGGPYGKRPAFCITAPDRGCGKSTLAWAIGKVWGGSVSVDVSQRGEDQLITRLLSNEALLKVVCTVDNVKGALSSAKLEALITDEWVNGHALYRGDSSRPNVLTWFITANGVRLSRDLAQRSYFVELTKPSYHADWDKKLSEYVIRHADEIVADVLSILQTSRAQASLGLNDRWSRWAEEVLVPACAHPALREFVGADVRGVIESTRALREECDDSKEESEMFVLGLLERICGSSGEKYRGANLIEMKDRELLQQDAQCIPTPSGLWWIIRKPLQPFFVSSEEMLGHWQAIFGKRLNSKQIKHIIREHSESGRITGIKEARRKTANGYEVSQELQQGYVDEFIKSLGAARREVAVG